MCFKVGTGTSHNSKLHETSLQKKQACNNNQSNHLHANLPSLRLHFESYSTSKTQLNPTFFNIFRYSFRSNLRLTDSIWCSFSLNSNFWISSNWNWSNFFSLMIYTKHDYFGYLSKKSYSLLPFIMQDQLRDVLLLRVLKEKRSLHHVILQNIAAVRKDEVFLNEVSSKGRE